MTVQVEVEFDLHLFYFLRKEAGIMPEQSVHRREEIDPDQQVTITIKQKGDYYENYRHDRTGKIQCRN